VDIGEERGTVQTYAEKQGLTFLILLDEKSAVAQKYRVSGIPTSFFINRQGVVQARHTGPMNDSLIKKHLDHIL
jgi:peroxiredoxin